jgi:ORF6N domain
MELEVIQNRILEIRGHKIMLDVHLAELYGVETRALKQTVRRNTARFPSDFMFELTKTEWNEVITNWDKLIPETAKFSPALPFAFTEQGVAMLSSVLKSDKAVQVNIAIVRAFVMLRQYAINYKELRDKIAELETKYDEKFEDINEVLDELMSPKFERNQIGFNIEKGL